MNLSKEQLQRAILGVIMVLIAIYGYFSMLLGPLSGQEKSAIKGLADLEPKLKEASTQLNRTRSIESGDVHAERAKAIRELIEERIPREAAIVWLPQQAMEIFHAEGIENVSVSFDKSTPDAELPGFVLSRWTAQIPSTGYHQLGRAIAALENHFGLAQIGQIEMQSTPGSVEKQAVTLNFSTVTRR